MMQITEESHSEVACAHVNLLLKIQKYIAVTQLLASQESSTALPPLGINVLNLIFNATDFFL